MPIDPMFADPMLGTFRNMAAECRAKGMSGPSFDAMNAELAKMEGYAAEMSDFSAFSARLVADNCFDNFSRHYGQCLADQARGQQQAAAAAAEASGGDPDAGLMAQTLAGYQNALDAYRAEVAAGRMSTVQAAMLTHAVQAVIDLGRSGVSYPVFLRQMVERGLDRALEGSAVVRDGLLIELEWAQFQNYPLDIELRQALLVAFDQLAAAAPFGVPDALAFELRRQRIEWEFEPRLAAWKAVTRRWENLLGIVEDWLDAFTGFAPYDSRWAVPGSPSATRRNIRRTKECAPFRLREFERIFAETCGMGWADIFRHPTYAVAWHNVDISTSAAKLELILATRPLCLPGGQPSGELIAASERLREQRGDVRHAELEAKKQRMVQRYDQFYGAGAYARDYPG